MGSQSKMCKMVKNEMSNIVGISKANIRGKQEAPRISKDGSRLSPVSGSSQRYALLTFEKAKGSKERVNENNVLENKLYRP